MSYRKYDYFFKLLIIGDSNVGKQPFLSRFIDDSFTATYFPTVGLDVKVKIINFQNKNVKLHITDMAGEERFRSVTKTYYKGSHGIILMYDVTGRNSFNNIRNWMKQIEANADKSVRKVLVGHKCDEPNRVVTEEEGKKLAEEFNMGFFESSAKVNKNVSEVFYYLVKEIFIEKGIFEDEKGIKLSDRKNKKDQCSK